MCFASSAGLAEFLGLLRRRLGRLCLGDGHLSRGGGAASPLALAEASAFAAAADTAGLAGRHGARARASRMTSDSGIIARGLFEGHGRAHAGREADVPVRQAADVLASR